MANALTAIRLALALPLAAALASSGLLSPGLVAIMLALALVTDYIDGPVARMTGTATPRGQLFDHSTDCFFVTLCLAGAAVAGSVTPLLPAVIPFAFAQYVIDSYIWARRKQLRASFLGRWNGIFYFVPIALIVGARLPFPPVVSGFIRSAATVLGYLLLASTVASMIDRATTPTRAADERA